MDDLNEAVRLDPKNANKFVDRGVVLTLSHAYDKAKADFDTAIASRAQLPIAFLNRAAVFEHAEKVRRRPPRP